MGDGLTKAQHTDFRLKIDPVAVANWVVRIGDRTDGIIEMSKHM